MPAKQLAAMTINKSLVRRYLILSLVASVVPVLFVGLLYDRFADVALEQVLGEKISAQLTATASRLSAFLDARRYQVETLANYPGIQAMVASGQAQPSEGVASLLQIEADSPDLYGILIFSSTHHLVRAVAGQAASGPPYWAGTTFTLAPLAVTRLGETEVVGPMLPQNGEAGWIVMRYPLAGALPDGNPAYVGLHVRLASLTELMGANLSSGAFEPLLQTPEGYFNTVGQLVLPKGKLIAGPEILPGWRPMFEVVPSQLPRPFAQARRALLLAVMIGSILIVLLFYRMSAQLGRRIRQLVVGADAVSTGNLQHRIVDHGDDEIASVSNAFNAMAAKLENFFSRMLSMEKLAMLGEFATSIAHEVRNPLAAIKTTVQALYRRESDPKRLELFRDMEKEIDRVARVVSDLVDFGRPRPPEFGVVSVREVFGRIFTLIESEAEKKGVHVSVQGDSGITLFADRDQVLQILLNLVLNAIQATPADGTVMLRASLENGRPLIEISDTGCGIAPELLARVTDPFFTTKSKGIGLGLNISKQLAELNGGKLEIASIVGRGTTVRIQFPNGKGNHV